MQSVSRTKCASKKMASIQSWDSVHATCYSQKKPIDLSFKEGPQRSIQNLWHFRIKHAFLEHKQHSLFNHSDHNVPDYFI